MDARHIEAHDDALIAVTSEHPVNAPMLVASPDQRTWWGRRAADVVAHTATGLVTRVVHEGNSILEIWKDDRSRRWSTRRILLWAWTGLGFWVIRSEVTARVYVVGDKIIHPHFLSNAWIQAWMVTEGAFVVAVFGPVVADYLKNAAPAITAIATGLRDRVIDPVLVRDPRMPSMYDDERDD